MKSESPQILRSFIFVFAVQIFSFSAFGNEAQNTVDLMQNRSLLKEHKLDVLENNLQSINDGYLRGTIERRVYIWAQQTLWRTSDLDEEWLPLALEKWIEQRPDSAQAQVVMGRYYQKKAFKARGGKFSNKTTANQFSQMEMYFEKAKTHLEAGLKLDPNIIDGHVSQFNIIKTQPNKSQKLSDILLRYADPLPDSVKKNEIFWSLLLQSSIPRWGGSYDGMRSTIDNYAVKLIPEITQKQILTLEDTLTYEQMYVSWLNKRYENVIELGKKSIENKTAFAGVYVLTAHAAKAINNYQQCFDQASYISKLRPWNTEVWELQGFCALKLEKWDAAKLAYQHKVYLGGISKYDIYQLGVSHMHLYEYDKAYAMFKKVLELDPSYERYTRRYTSYIEAEKPESMRLEGMNVFDMLSPMKFQYSKISR